MALARAFAGSFALIHVPRLALVAFALTQPLLITEALEYVQNHDAVSIKYGQALIGAFALNYLAIAVRSPSWPFSPKDSGLDAYNVSSRSLPFRINILPFAS